MSDLLGAKYQAWEWIQQERILGWYVMSGRSTHSGRWRAWGKKTPLAKRDPLAEPGDVYSETGMSRQDAINKLIASDIAPNA